jgi:polyisoprenoid-binding protein YceI
MRSRFSLFLSATLLGAAALSGCGTTPAEDRERVIFPARDDFPAGMSSLESLSPGQRTYSLDADLEKSHLYVQLFSASLGHDHVVGATDWTGTVRFDPSNLSGCSVAVTVQVEGVSARRPCRS